jgi:cyclophilin family peptidyl-prolyl cis-trans isomerase
MPKKTYAQAPTDQLDPSKRYGLVIQTTCGEIDVTLDVARAPKTTSSVAFLVRDGFYDGLLFHRVVPGFVIQGGDPQGTGGGGPGFTVVEVPPEGLRYEPGTVAMAKRGDEPAGASGSQFFIVSGPAAVQEGRQLPAEYALLGKVSKGMDVVGKIERSPAGTVSITTARIVES